MNEKTGTEPAIDFSEEIFSEGTGQTDEGKSDSRPPAGAGDEGKPAKKRSRKGKEALFFLRDMAICLAIVFLVLQIIGPTIVYEHSMDETLHPKDYVFLNKQAYSFGGTPDRGDIVVFESSLVDENGIHKKLIKRIVGLPGDTLEIHDGYVWVDGKKLDEPFTRDGETIGDMDEISIPENDYFVMGDNRLVSLDSRSPEVGLVREDDIIGKVIFRLFPLSRIGLVS
ncbi:MAG: signal peptidase I [Clostridiales Family XIII bacterium]|jgi:signal peptidase I|nr:signal peptidase I [Clostridiales Family XIII bacterium]